MSRNFSLSQLAEGITERNLADDDARLVEKWGRTGLLKNLSARKRTTMARLLENQMAQIIRESNALSTGGGSMTSSGQIRGFSNIAFPIVRKVFGGLVANELVSIQPMSLPSGLLFYLDYTYGVNVGGENGPSSLANSTDATYAQNSSIYGNPTGRGVQSGSLAAGGMYDLVGHGFSKVHSGTLTLGTIDDIGHFGGTNGAWLSGSALTSEAGATGSNGRHLFFDPDVITALGLGTFDVAFMHVSASAITTSIPRADLRGSAIDQLTVTDLGTNASVVAWGSAYQNGAGVLNLRRLNKRGDFNGVTFTANAENGTHVQMVLRIQDAGTLPTPASDVHLSAMLRDLFDVNSADGTALTLSAWESDFGNPPNAIIPEIDIKIEAIPVTADTRKLRARWTPELAQDLNAYHSIDAEVELTQILSQQIALEIDREVLGDLVRQANGAVRYWSRKPGVFLNKLTGAVERFSSSLDTGPSFTGNVAEWYSTLIEMIIDAANEIHRKTLRGSANFIVTSPDVCTILESSMMYKPSIKFDGSGQASAPFVIGAEAIGTISNRFTVYKDPFFPRNRILVGFKGGSYLETGYVYAPYIPLIVTPTIYGPDDFTPRKGVMTRYGKQMVRSDFYGVVNILDMNIS